MLTGTSNKPQAAVVQVRDKQLAEFAAQKAQKAQAAPKATAAK